MASRAEQQVIRKEWETRVTEFRVSGQSATAWCSEHRIKTHQLWYWLRKYPSEESIQSQPNKWIPIEIDKSPVNETDSVLLVRIGQAVIEVRPGYNRDLLSDVVRILNASC